MGSGAPLYCSAPSQGAVAQLVRVPVCHTGGRGFEPRQPRLDPRRGMTHRAPSATAGGAFAFSGSVVTSTYHKSVLADVVRAWAEGSRRAVDAELLNSWPADRLARCFADYADAPPPRARRLARVIVKRRARAPFAVSDDLVNAIRETLGPRSGPADFARIFQALRIVVNQELEQIELALPALRAALQPGGRLGVISYHSGEDRIVKHAFRDWSKACVCPPRQPVCTNLEGHRAALERRMRAAESRAGLVPRAQRLGLRLPSDSEIILLPLPPGDPR